MYFPTEVRNNKYFHTKYFRTSVRNKAHPEKNGLCVYEGKLLNPNNLALQYVWLYFRR